MHLLNFCPHVAKFWVSIHLWLRSMDIVLQMTPQKMLLCIFEGKCIHFLNIIILMGKFFIFKAKTLSNLCIKHFKNRVFYQYVLETFIATNKNRITEHENKWNVCLFELEI